MQAKRLTINCCSSQVRSLYSLTSDLGSKANRDLGKLLPYLKYKKALVRGLK